MTLLFALIVACFATADNVHVTIRDEANAVRVLEAVPANWTKPKRRLIVFATPQWQLCSAKLWCASKTGSRLALRYTAHRCAVSVCAVHTDDADLVLVILQSGNSVGLHGDNLVGWRRPTNQATD